MSNETTERREEYTNAMGDTHALRIFGDGSVIVDDFDAFSSYAIAIRFCNVETIYDEEMPEIARTQAHKALYGEE